MSIEEMLKSNRFGDVYILARYFYRIGDPIFSDNFYDKLETCVRKINAWHLNEYVNRTYDNDPIPELLLEEIDYQWDSTTSSTADTSHTEREELRNYLDEEKGLGIQAHTSYESSFHYFVFLKKNKLDFVASLKTDGVNTRMLYKDGEYKISLSRGRADGESLDYTLGSARVMPRRLKDPLTIRIIGDSYVEEDYLEVLRKKYDVNSFKTCKSSALSLLRVLKEEEDYKHLKTNVFMANGLAETLAETFTKLKTMGIDTVPYRLFSWEEIPDEFVLFQKWLKEEVFDCIYEAGKGIPSDGVVIEVNDFNWISTEKNQYSNRQIALKFEQWSFPYYKGIVRNVIIEQQRVRSSVRIEIEPMKTEDGSNAFVINSFNPAILINEDLYVGKEVYFERNSNAINVLLHGDRLRQVLAEEEAINKLHRCIHLEGF